MEGCTSMGQESEGTSQLVPKAEKQQPLQPREAAVDLLRAPLIPLFRALRCRN
jgi:hypothetical protein